MKLNCNYCSKKVAINNYETHLTNVHNVEKAYECNTCHAKYALYANYFDHLAEHEDIKSCNNDSDYDSEFDDEIE